MRAITTIIGKLIRAGVRIKSQGSSFPGFIVEKINPAYLKSSLDLLPKGVVIISGTNGKTTTTKIVSSLLESQGLRVFTNPTGSNFIRGVISAILEKATLTGKLNFDIAVLELDEAYAELFVKQYKPKYALLLNVARDQLDRFGEIDKTASMLNAVSKSTTDLVVLNANDSSVAELETSANRVYFDINKSLKNLFLNDDELHGKIKNNLSNKSVSKVSAHQTICKLLKIKNGTAQIEYRDKKYSFSPQLSGVYNLYNATAALALATQIAADSDFENLLKSLEKIKPAFGRGEIIELENATVELILVKNPAGFRLALASYPLRENIKIMIAINDNYADSRDISWLWDVDFANLNTKNAHISTSGTRAWDMALRLAHDEMKVSNVGENLANAIDNLVANAKNQTIRIFASYTAMLESRKILGKYTKISEAGAE
ncbi:MAG: DUF1727 domain-containing protein [Bifidobacteriaceae bacterium]|jgi:UDP-N-acetylmuramyl tripeptide synthase|nr:DUF1727 domain-containing protein [Bifidobacteriaceae bacterium]